MSERLHLTLFVREVRLVQERERPPDAPRMIRRVSETSGQLSEVCVVPGRDTSAGKLEAVQEGYQNGYDEGLENGSQDGLAQLHLAVQTLHDLAATLATQQQRWITQAEPAIVALALEVARKVIKRTVETDEELVTRIVHEALSHVVESSHLTIRVHPDDVRVVAHHLPDFGGRVDGMPAMEVVSDPAIGRGGCLLETGSGTIDARLTTQIRALEQALCQ